MEYNDEGSKHHNRSQRWNNNNNRRTSADGARDTTSPMMDDRDSLKTVEDYNFHLLKSI
jgi:hypothetical protein